MRCYWICRSLEITLSRSASRRGCASLSSDTAKRAASRPPPTMSAARNARPRHAARRGLVRDVSLQVCRRPRTLPPLSFHGAPATCLEENARIVHGRRTLLQRRRLAAVGRVDGRGAMRACATSTMSPVPELDAMVERLKAGGAAGARIVGGGFGGSVLALFPPGVTPPEDALEVAPGSSSATSLKPATRTCARGKPRGKL